MTRWIVSAFNRKDRMVATLTPETHADAQRDARELERKGYRAQIQMIDDSGLCTVSLPIPIMRATTPRVADGTPPNDHCQCEHESHFAEDGAEFKHHPYGQKEPPHFLQPVSTRYGEFIYCSHCVESHLPQQLRETDHRAAIGPAALEALLRF